MTLLAPTFGKNTVAARFHGNWDLCGYLNIDFRFCVHGAAEYCFVMSQVADYYLGDSEE